MICSIGSTNLPQREKEECKFSSSGTDSSYGIHCVVLRRKCLHRMLHNILHGLRRICADWVVWLQLCVGGKSKSEIVFLCFFLCIRFVDLRRERDPFSMKETAQTLLVFIPNWIYDVVLITRIIVKAHAFLLCAKWCQRLYICVCVCVCFVFRVNLSLESANLTFEIYALICSLVLTSPQREKEAWRYSSL